MICSLTPERVSPATELLSPGTCSAGHGGSPLPVLQNPSRSLTPLIVVPWVSASSGLVSASSPTSLLSPVWSVLRGVWILASPGPGLQWSQGPMVFWAGCLSQAGRLADDRIKEANLCYDFTNKFQVKMSFTVLLALEYSNFSTVVLAGLPGENSPVY